MCDLKFVKDVIVITNRHLVEGDYLTQISKVVSLHPHAVILREKDISDAEYEALARAVLDICDKAQVPCFIHSRYDIARRLGCSNIHVSITGLQESGHEINQFENVSVSCHSLEDVTCAISHGATQIILGTIYETECKKGLKGKGAEFVREICEYTKDNGDIPVYAIGGISPDNIAEVKAAGAHGGCMMSYMMTI